MERIISDSIAYSIVNVLGKDQIEHLDISVFLISPRGRKLLREQDTGEKQETIAFDAVIGIQSILEAHDVDRYTIGGFNDQIEQVLFLVALKDTGDPAFAKVDSVSVGSNHLVRAVPANPGGSDPAAVAISILVAVAAVIGAAFAFLCYRRQYKKAEAKIEALSCRLEKLERASQPSDRVLNETMASSSFGDGEEIPVEIHCDSSSEVTSRLDASVDVSDRSVSIAPSDEAKDHIIDNLSLLSGESIEYDFEEIFRSDVSLVSDPSTIAKQESLMTYNNSEREHHEKIDTRSPAAIALGISTETKLRDEDGNTIEE